MDSIIKEFKDALNDYKKINIIVGQLIERLKNDDEKEDVEKIIDFSNVLEKEIESKLINMYKVLCMGRCIDE